MKQTNKKVLATSLLTTVVIRWVCWQNDNTCWLMNNKRLNAIIFNITFNSFWYFVNYSCPVCEMCLLEPLFKTWTLHPLCDVWETAQVLSGEILYITVHIRNLSYTCKTGYRCEVLSLVVGCNPWSTPHLTSLAVCCEIAYEACSRILHCNISFLL